VSARTGRPAAARAGDVPASRGALDEVERVALAAAGRDVTAAVGSARARAELVAAATGDEAEAATTLASSALAAMAIAGAVPDGAARDVVHAVADLRSTRAETASLELCLRALVDASVGQAPPARALCAQVRLLAALAPVAGVSVWLVAGDNEAPAATAGEMAEQPRADDCVVVPLAGEDAVLAARPRSASDRDAAAAYLELARVPVQGQVERARKLEREAADEVALAEASSRRLVRIGLDLHDGALQAIVALAADARLFRSQLAAVVGDEHREIVLGRVDDLEARLAELERELRELAQSLQPHSLVTRPFREVVRGEVEAFGERSGISTTLTLDGGFAELTASQRLALLRIIQEALTNAREHGRATNVTIAIAESEEEGLRLDVEDNGSGFAVERALERAHQRGRLGVAGMRERVALLGGSLTIESRSGGPTIVSARLPRWTPPRKTAETA
jgi:signal transduction histidine kinase